MVLDDAPGKDLSMDLDYNVLFRGGFKIGIK